MKKIFVLGAAMALLATLSVSGESRSNAVSISFSGTGATAEGITPGGQAVWLVLSIDEFNGWPRLWRRVEVASDDDKDGKVGLELKPKPSSVWVAVDFMTGAYAVAGPNGRRPSPLRSRGDDWRGGRAHLDFVTSELLVLLVRPGKAAWLLRTEQGGRHDGDGRADGNLRVKLSDMELIHGSDKPPPVALPRDLLVAIDPGTLFTFVQSAAGNQQ